MTIQTEAKKPTNRVYADLYLKRRYPDGTFDSDWIDISRYVAGGGYNQIKYQLDSGDFDVGVFVANSVNVVLSNNEGRFNEIDDSRSYWSMLESRNLSKIKIEAGYIDENDAKVSATPFEGILDDKSFVINDDDTVSFTVLARESVFKSLEVITGTLASSISASDAIYTLCYRGEVVDYMTLDSDNINPGNDITIDDPTVYDGKKLDSVLAEILVITNSVMYVDENGNLIVKNREHTRRPVINLYSNASTGQHDNIYRITAVNNGRHRVKNLWYWSGSAINASSSAYFHNRYGVTRKSISYDSITTGATKQSIIDALLAEWQYPKQEFIVTTDFIPGVINFYDTITLDVNPRYSRQDDLAISGLAVSGTARSVSFLSGLKISPLLGFKILAYHHDLNNATTTMKVRNIGNQINDGYLEMVLSETYTVAFAASSTEDIDVSPDGLNAQRCKVEVLDTGDDYETLDIEVTRPDANTITLTTGVAITKTLRVLVVETKA